MLDPKNEMKNFQVTNHKLLLSFFKRKNSCCCNFMKEIRNIPCINLSTFGQKTSKRKTKFFSKEPSKSFFNLYAKVTSRKKSVKFHALVFDN